MALTFGIPETLACFLLSFSCFCSCIGIHNQISDCCFIDEVQYPDTDTPIPTIEITTLKAERSVVSVGNVCSICLKKYKMGQEIDLLECGHYFHNPCFESWKAQKAKENKVVSCPDCRAGDAQ